jgi:DNA-binding NarL/FixJ family response regulator
MTVPPIEPTAVRVLLADDQPTIRLGLQMILDHEPDLQVVAQAADGLAAVELAERLRPDVALLDVRMPGLDGVAATAQIRARCPDVRVVVITTFEDDEYVVGALRAGADGFLLKACEPERLIDAVRRVAAGEALLDPRVTGTVLDRYRSLLSSASGPAGGPPPTSGPTTSGPTTSAAGGVRAAQLDRLTPRERDVLVVLASGAPNREIAARLALTETTVKTYVHALLTKLERTTRAELVALAYESGLVVPGRSA